MKRTVNTSITRFVAQAFILFFALSVLQCCTPNKSTALFFEVSIPNPASNNYEVDMTITGANQDSLVLIMPEWMPGYYQIMNYAKNIQAISAADENGNNLLLEKQNDHSWPLTGKKFKSATIHYEISTKRKFVATSYVDAEHAYLIPGASFLYVKGKKNLPATVKINLPNEWKNVATGLETISEKDNTFLASDFDVLYDCPILIGNLEELPSFKVNGIEHRFVGYKLGEFDKITFIENLEKIVKTAVDLMGDIPYKKYTFIAIGPGMGGIEHLNNTTISFDGNKLKDVSSTNRTLSFIAHEYFHNYNVKRIRPFELGPFDYEKQNRTNQLWVSEGLTVYYEYLLMKRSGIANASQLYSFFSNDIKTVENDNGRFFQSLSQSSYYTWEDGPFGTGKGEEDRTISYYDKGPVVGLLLDFAIRNATKNKKSLDDVMRYLYRYYYQELQRGFTEAELQQACETVAGTPLSDFFEYVYTTKEPDYNKYLGYAGLELQKEKTRSAANYTLTPISQPSEIQLQILKSWLGED